MKTAVLSDIHSNLPALIAVKKEIDEMDPELVVCAGDTVGYGASPNECCSLLARWADHACLGNHDAAALYESSTGMNPYAAKAAAWTAAVLEESSRKYLHSLAESARFRREGKDFALHHGSLTSIWEYLFEDDISESILDEAGAQILIFGHTHVPYVRRYPGGLVVNPGSVGQPRDGNPKASYAVMDTDGPQAEIRRVEYDIDAAADAILNAGLPDMLAERLFRGH